MSIPDKVEVTIEIENYRMEIGDYFKWYPIAFFVMLVFPIPGLIWFIKRIRKKKKLDQKRIEILKMINDLGPHIPLEEFLDMKKRLNTARKY
jgi:hypothetical protein